MTRTVSRTRLITAALVGALLAATATAAPAAAIGTSMTKNGGV